jgi:dephospho-CoA kinase
MSKPYRVGLTGGIGSGKSQVSNQFLQLGIPVIDADNIVHELTTTNVSVKNEINEAFKKSVLDSTGQLDRNKLRTLIFSDNEARVKLESILHPLVYETINGKIKDLTSTYCILSIPLLLETGATSMVDTVLVVDCPIPLQIERVCKRDGLSFEEVKNIINAQISRHDRLLAANEVILNDKNLDDLSNQVKELHINYLIREKHKPNF